MNFMNLRLLFISFSLILILLVVSQLLLLLLQAYFLNPFEPAGIIGSRLGKDPKDFLNLNFRLIEVIINLFYFKFLLFGQFQQVQCQIVRFSQITIQDLLHFNHQMVCLFFKIFLHQSQLKDPILRQRYFFFLKPHDLHLIKLKKGQLLLQVILHTFFRQLLALFLLLILVRFLLCYQYRQFNLIFQFYQRQK